jgi:hypothetical protein
VGPAGRRSRACLDTVQTTPSVGRRGSRSRREESAIDALAETVCRGGREECASQEAVSPLHSFQCAVLVSPSSCLPRLPAGHINPPLDRHSTVGRTDFDCATPTS